MVQIQLEAAEMPDPFSPCEVRVSLMKSCNHSLYC